MSKVFQHDYHWCKQRIFKNTPIFSKCKCKKNIFMNNTQIAILVPQMVSKGGDELSGWIQSLNLTEIIITKINNFSRKKIPDIHYSDVIMGMIAYQITSLTIVFSTVYSDADQRKHQSSASLAFVRGIHRGLVNSPHKWPVTRKMFQFMTSCYRQTQSHLLYHIHHLWYFYSFIQLFYWKIMIFE